MAVVPAAWIIVGTRSRSSVKNLLGGRETLDVAAVILMLLTSQT
jgi:hypothetical protein